MIYIVYRESLCFVKKRSLGSAMHVVVDNSVAFVSWNATKTKGVGRSELLNARRGGASLPTIVKTGNCSRSKMAISNIEKNKRQNSC
jgi:hypothetical protein